LALTVIILVRFNTAVITNNIIYYRPLSFNKANFIFQLLNRYLIRRYRRSILSKVSSFLLKQASLPINSRFTEIDRFGGLLYQIAVTQN
jgi:hypothetical protein